MKLGIIIGHNATKKGAYGVKPLDAFEYDYNSKIATQMSKLCTGLKIDSKVFRRKNSGNYRKEIETVYRQSDKWGSDATIELHFNAFNKKVTGTETLAGPSDRSLILAMDVHRQVVAAFGRTLATDRGVKEYRNVVRGQLSLVSGNAPAIIVEPFFGDATADAKLAKSVGQDALAAAYVAGIAKWFGVSSPVPETSDTLEHIM